MPWIVKDDYKKGEHVFVVCKDKECKGEFDKAEDAQVFADYLNEREGANNA